MHLFENSRKICIVETHYPQPRPTIWTHVVHLRHGGCAAVSGHNADEISHFHIWCDRNEKLCISLSAVQLRTAAQRCRFQFQSFGFVCFALHDLCEAVEFIARIMMRFSRWMHDVKCKFIGRETDVCMCVCDAFEAQNRCHRQSRRHRHAQRTSNNFRHIQIRSVDAEFKVNNLK